MVGAWEIDDVNCNTRHSGDSSSDSGSSSITFGRDIGRGKGVDEGEKGEKGGKLSSYKMVWETEIIG